jgi:hypothetical protein
MAELDQKLAGNELDTITSRQQHGREKAPPIADNPSLKMGIATHCQFGYDAASHPAPLR